VNTDLYNPPAFQIHNHAILYEFIRIHPFATIISQGGETLRISHIPILIEEGGAPEPLLIGHIARRNPQCESLRRCQEVLLLFIGPNTYISPSWYEDQSAIPTINYIAVHVNDRVRPIHDKKRTLHHLQALVQYYEGSGADHWSMSLLSKEFVADSLEEIMAFEVAVTRMEGKFKLSQNRELVD
jgi:transcriptional regulator